MNAPSRPAKKAPAIISDLDIGCTAKPLVDQNGENAPLEAAIRANRMLGNGDLDGQTVWRRVKGAAEELLKAGPRDGEAQH